ncbi:CMRF35-like molecule 8 isoform X2 [Pseudorasbora parva]|uniref:CMRF35-like molecule 8 isoform X2 n=1 Tax=Pseudorasbora parva TaxID=51549 RepID=UPI00351F097C
MWKARVFCFCIGTVCLLDISCAVIGYEGGEVTFHVRYPPDYEKNSKYFGISDVFFFEKLVQTTESNRWARQGRFALLDNTSAHLLTAAIFGLILEDSGMYTFGVDVKMLPDPDIQIELTVKKGQPLRPTTSLPRVIVSTTNSPANNTEMNWTKTSYTESYHSLVTVLSLVCVCPLLVVCSFALFKVLKLATSCNLSVSVSYHTRTTSDHTVDEYVKMSPVVLTNSPSAQSGKGSSVKAFHRPTNTQQTPDKDANYIELTLAEGLDQIYTEMKPDFAQESVYCNIEQTID